MKARLAGFDPITGVEVITGGGGGGGAINWTRPGVLAARLWRERPPDFPFEPLEPPPAAAIGRVEFGELAPAMAPEANPADGAIVMTPDATGVVLPFTAGCVSLLGEAVDSSCVGSNDVLGAGEDSCMGVTVIGALWLVPVEPWDFLINRCDFLVPGN